MTAPSRLTRFIRFELSNLSSQNAHHEFEHLCRHVARLRIASNVIPATGPVAAGGDQGRDFETFRSYLHGQLPFAIGFLALAAEDTVAFACTLQQDDLASKIRADMKTICSQGTRVDRIVVFAAHAVPVATRHRLQAGARENHDVALDIFDGEAIAEMLSEHELFWIAEEYLHLPAELRPPAPPGESALPDWYTNSRQDWQTRDTAPVSLGDLLELTRGLRHATFYQEARGDLPGWLTLFESLLAVAPGRETRQRARYEIAVATLRGTGVLGLAQGHVRDFFSELDMINSPTLLFDASVLLQYCEGACRLGAADLVPQDIAMWNARARQRADILLAAQPPPNTLAVLLDAAAHLALHFDYAGIPVPKSERVNDPDTIARATQAAVENDELPTVPSDMRFVDLEAGMAYLSELVDLLPRAPMFPVDSLTARFDMLSPALVDHPLYPSVRDGLDSAMALQAGGDAVATSCRRRALAMLRADRLLDALREFHEAKVNWWHGDTLRGSLLAMAMVAEIYSRLLMPTAAKKYALALAICALRAPDATMRDLVPRGLFMAATYDHQAGAWISSAETTSVAALAQVNYLADPWDSERYPHIQTAVAEQGFTVLAAQQHRPALTGPLREILDSAGFGDFIDFAIEQVADQPSWTEGEWIAAGSDMTAPPFSDAGPQKLIRFVALGLRWTIRCANERPLVLAAEAFAAAVQILLVELATRDPLFLPGDIEIEVRLCEANRTDAPAAEQHAVSQADGHWLVYAPAPTTASCGSEHQGVHLLSILVRILAAHSLLQEDQFIAVMESAFRAGLTHKLEVGRPYQELADLKGEDYRSPARGIPIDPLGDDVLFPERCAPQLVPPSHPGPGYTREKALDMVRARYERTPPVMRHALPRLLADIRTRDLFAELQREGWKDWHLLIALANLVVNARVAVRFGAPTWGNAPSFRSIVLAEMNRPEEADDPSVATETVTRQALEDALHISMMATVQNWGLEIRQSPVDPKAVLKVLGDRYGYWADDVDHEKFFPAD